MSDAERYERVVRHLLRTKLAHDSGITPKIIHRASFTGASGQSYEIDLSFETTIAGARILILVECKCYSRPVGVDDVSEFAYKIRDIGAHKGILVTTTGFQQGAKTIAIREGIALVQAGESWVMQVYSMKLGPKIAKYVIYDADRRTFKYPGGSTDGYDGPPPPKYSFQLLSDPPPKWALSGPVLSFRPALDGFYGLPVNVFDAAAFFLAENQLPFGSLFDVPNRWSESFEYGL